MLLEERAHEIALASLIEAFAGVLNDPFRFLFRGCAADLLVNPLTVCSDQLFLPVVADRPVERKFIIHIAKFNSR
jgi:hypothetical protein